jgi:hypothetical protein
MKPLDRRLTRLETSTAQKLARWIRIIGRTEEQARADYEVEHGPIAADANIIFVQIVSPGEVK